MCCVGVCEVNVPILPGLWWPAPSAGRLRRAASLSQAPSPSPSDSSRSRTGPESACPCLRSHTAHTDTREKVRVLFLWGDDELQRTAVSCQVLAHLGVASEEAVRDGDVDVEGQRLQDVRLHGDDLLTLVGVVADVEEVVDARRTALLQV